MAGFRNLHGGGFSDLKSQISNRLFCFHLKLQDLSPTLGMCSVGIRNSGRNKNEDAVICLADDHRPKKEEQAQWLGPALAEEKKLEADAQEPGIV